MSVIEQAMLYVGVLGGMAMGALAISLGLSVVDRARLWTVTAVALAAVVALTVLAIAA